MPGSPFYVTDTHIRNQYQIRLINKDTGKLSFTASVQANGLDFPLEISGFEGAIALDPMEESNATFVVQVPRDTFAGSFPLEIVIEAEPGGIEITREVEFLGPDPALLRRPVP